MPLTRRGLLAAGIAALPLAAEAQVTRALRPMPRPAGGAAAAAAAAPEAGGILSESGLGAVTGFAVVDLASGRILEAHRPDAALPPASVTKICTTLYGLAALGPGYRFPTAVVATGPVAGGRLEGDLFLLGGGDPHLDTDALADLAAEVAKAGIREIAGRAFVVGAALPGHAYIDELQPPHAGYNPGISGMNLNFNRVHFEWKPKAGDYEIAVTARAARFDPAVSTARIAIEDRGAPIFDYRMENGHEFWSVSRNALGKGGARWLPVRIPAAYAAEVFRILAANFGLRLPPLERAAALPPGVRVIASRQSDELQTILRAMLRYSTNLTAEVVGLRAHQAWGGTPASIADSAAAMRGWLSSDYGMAGARFLNHSGLTDETRTSAAELCGMLARAAAGPLPGLLHDHPVAERPGANARLPGVTIAAKTGTLNFARALAGYIGPEKGAPRLAFAILAADMETRAKIDPRIERPRGGRAWLGRARTQEDALLRRWAALHMG